MKEREIDSMKYRKSTHLAGVDVDIIISEKGECLLNIKDAFFDRGVDVSGNKTDGYFLEFSEDVKPMVVNSGNRKIIGKIAQEIKKLNDTDSRNIGNWIGLTIELYYDSKVTMMGKRTGGIKVKEKAPKVRTEKEIKLIKAKAASFVSMAELNLFYASLTAKEKTNKEVVQILKDKQLDLKQK